MISHNEIDEAKARFLHRYNRHERLDACLEEAGHDALLSALQRNRLYAPIATARVRSTIRGAWHCRLRTIALAYVDEVGPEEYQQHFMVLRERMNAEFAEYLAPTGFRVSHAQKSLSVYLKHLWCLGQVGRPPCCPVDRLILSAAGAPLNDRTWTTVDTTQDYRRQLGYLQAAADRSGDPVAVWELINFPSGS